MSRVSEPPSFKDTAGGTVSGVLRRRSKSQSRREIMPSFFVNSDVDITGANGMVFLFGWGCLNGFFIRRPGLKIRLCALPCYAKP